MVIRLLKISIDLSKLLKTTPLNTIIYTYNNYTKPYRNKTTQNLHRPLKTAQDHSTKHHYIHIQQLYKTIS